MGCEKANKPVIALLAVLLAAGIISGQGVTGALTGFVLAGPGNTVTLGRAASPGSAAADAAVSVGNNSARSASNGAITVAGIHAGLDTLHVRTAAGQTADFPVTIFGGATAKLGAPKVARDAALALVMREVRSGKGDPSGTIVMGPQEPIPAGTTVAPVYGDDDGRPSSSLEYTARSEEWFLFVDPETTARYQHPVEYYFVDAATGAVGKRNATSWPLINNLGYYGNRDQDVKSRDLMAGPAIGSTRGALARKPPMLSGGWGSSGHVPLTRILAALFGSPISGLPMGNAFFQTAAGATTAAAGGSTLAMIIEGADDSDENADISNIQGLFGQAGIPAASDTQTAKPDSTATGRSPRMDTVNADLRKLCAKSQPNDTLFIYITGHGTKGGGVQLDSTGVDKFGDPVGFETLTAGGLDLSGCKACKIVVIIDACYSGKMATQFDTALKKKNCVNYTILSSADSTHESRAYPGYDPRGPTGGFFTNKLIAAVNAQTSGGGTADLGQAFQKAKDEMSGSWRTGVAAQNPQIIEHHAPVGCVCGEPPATAENHGGAGDSPGTPPPPNGGSVIVKPPTTGTPTPGTTTGTTGTSQPAAPKTATGQPSETPSGTTTPKAGDGGGAAIPGGSGQIRGVVLPRTAGPGQVSGHGVTDPERYAGIPGLQVVPVRSTETVDLGDGRKQPVNGPVTATVPARTATIPVRVYDPAQPQPVLQTTVPVQSTTATTTAITHAPADCTMPPVASPGGVEVIHVANGGSSGDVSQISVTVDDTPATIVAAKPGTVFWNVPDTMAAGLHHVRFVPGRDAPAVMLPVYVMTLQMSAERTSLIRGQSTTMHVTVAGLDKMPASLWKAATPPADLVDVPSLEQRAKGFRPPKQAGPGVVLLVIENHSIAQIHMGKAGDRIVLELGQKDFASGPYSYADKLQSLNSGSFDIGSIATAFLADAEGN